MSRYRVTVSSAAHAEVAEAIAYITEQGSPDIAAHRLAGLEAVFHSLQEYLERFPAAPEDKYFPDGILRRAMHHSHRVLFTIDGDAVLVLHVRHAMRRELDQP